MGRFQVIAFYLAIIAIGIHSISTTSESEDGTRQEQTIHLNVSYGPDPRNILDLYIPTNSDMATTKVILLIHGGAWGAGSKEMIFDQVVYFFRAFPHLAVANMNYRLATVESPSWPKQMEDVGAAISFLKSHAQEYRINPRFTLFGESAGAHLSMLYSYGFDQAGDVDAVINVVGPANIVDEKLNQDPLFIYLVGNTTFAENPEIYYLNNPTSYVSPSSPTTISFYGDSDHLIPSDQGEMLEDALDESGICNKYYLYAGAGHGNFTDEQAMHMGKKIGFFLGNVWK